MIDDAELLRRYAEEESEAAFAELVQRHVNFVYACALRRVGGDAHLAEDVTQQVFTALARSAAALARREVLSGWLYTTARNVSAQVVRTERRRQVRESEAQLMNELTSSSARDAEWEQLRPVLDDALDELGDGDREAVLLRFFEGKDFAQVGKILNVTDNAARMRVERALDKLHGLLARRGVTSTSAALAVAMANQAGVAAPAGLAASVTEAVMASVAAGDGVALATVMSFAKLQVGLAVAVGIAVSVGIGVQAWTNEALRVEAAGLRQKAAAIARLRVENERLARTAVEVGALHKDDAELARLREEALALRQQLAEAQGPPKSGGFAAFNGDTGSLAGLLNAYEQLGRVRIVKEPAVAAIKPRARAPLTQPMKPIDEVLADLRGVLRQKWNVVLEPAADGSLIAKLAGP